MNLRDLFFLKSLGGGVKVDTAAVGQTIVVKSIDGDGKPTEWEATDPGEKWEHICDLTPDGTVRTVKQTFDSEYRKIVVTRTGGSGEIVTGSSQTVKWDAGVSIDGAQDMVSMTFAYSSPNRAYVGITELIGGRVIGAGFFANGSPGTYSSDAPDGAKGFTGVFVRCTDSSYLLNAHTFAVYGVRA